MFDGGEEKREGGRGKMVERRKTRLGIRRGKEETEEEEC